MKRLLLAASLLLALMAVAEAKTYRLAVVPKQAGGFYWDAIHAGLLRARNDLAKQHLTVEIVWLPPGGAGTAADQAALIAKASGARFDAMLVAPIDVETVRPAVEAATRDGLPVLVFDTPLSSPRVIAYVGTNNYEAGQLAGGWLGKSLGEQGSVLIVGDPALPNVAQREKGCVDGAHLFPNVFMISTGDYADAIPAFRPALAGAVMKKYAARITGLFIADPEALAATLDGLEAADLGGTKVARIASGNLPSLVDALRAGKLQALVVDNPYGIGIQAVRTAIEALEGRRVDARITVSAALVTADKVDDPSNSMALRPPISEVLQDGKELPVPAAEPPAPATP